MNLENLNSVIDVVMKESTFWYYLTHATNIYNNYGTYGNLGIIAFFLYHFRHLFTEVNLESFIVFTKFIYYIGRNLGIILLIIIITTLWHSINFVFSYFKVKYYLEIIKDFLFCVIILKISFLLSIIMYLIIPRRLLIKEQNDSDDLNQSYSDDSEIIVKKKVYKTKSIEQLEILSKWVVLNGLYPNKKDIYILSLQTKLDEKQIKNWFNDYKKKLN